MLDTKRIRNLANDIMDAAEGKGTLTSEQLLETYEFMYKLMSLREHIQETLKTRGHWAPYDGCNQCDLISAVGIALDKAK